MSFYRLRQLIGMFYFKVYTNLVPHQTFSSRYSKFKPVIVQSNYHPSIKYGKAAILQRANI